MRKAYRTNQCCNTSSDIQHVIIVNKLIQMQHTCYSKKHHVTEINLHTNTTQILSNPIVQHYIL